MVLSSTISTSKTVAAPRTQVWTLVSALDEWSNFQDTFTIETIENDATIQVGTVIRIVTRFPFFTQVTREVVSAFEENERICWDQIGVVPVDPIPSFLLRTTGLRCIELMDDGSQGTVLHNYIGFEGLLWPFVILFVGNSIRKAFDSFNDEVANQFSKKLQYRVRL